MIIRACAFTTEGWKVIDRLEQKLLTHCFERREKEQELSDWIKEGFEYNAPILFVGAIGIAVRKIAPFLENKLIDSPVVVVDEGARFVVPLLSDHVGGAGDIASMIAKALEAQVVATTATDIRNKFSVDVFARRNGLLITDKDGIKRVSSKLLETGNITMAIDPAIEYTREDVAQGVSIVEYGKTDADVCIKCFDSKENWQQDKGSLLTLIYKPFVLGIGCKKNTEFGKIEDFVISSLKERNIDIAMVSDIASIDLKCCERGLLYFEAKYRIPFSVYSAKQLESVEGTFSESEFVKSVTGVSNVCERAAIKRAGEGATAIVNKIAGDGMTLAVSRRNVRIKTWET